MNIRKKILFRADGNNNIGLGHLYRLFALAEIYKSNYDVIFLTKEDSTLQVIPEGYIVKKIPINITINEEPIWLKKNFGHNDNNIIIIDGYQFISSYQKKIKKEGFFLIYIDDLTTEHMFADIVVNHSPFVKEDDFKTKKYTKLAIGTSYAMLRPVFLEAAKQQAAIRQTNTAFVCFGGADEDDLSLVVSKALLNFKDILEINVIIGGAYKHESIFELAEQNNIIKLHFNLEEVSLFKLMEKSSLAIAPCSTISYELCSVGVPLISGYFVENQLNIYKGFLKHNVFIDGGNLKNKNEEGFIKLIQKILDLTTEDSEGMLYNQYKLFNKNQRESFLSLITI